MKDKNNIKKALIIVAHPDDETLWAGGTILSHPSWKWLVVSLTRESDKERSENFKKALNVFGANGKMGDLDDGPEQMPLSMDEVKDNILSLLNERRFDVIITHHPAGEYTRHLRHEETAVAVIHLWHDEIIETRELWFFAYEDGGKSYFPRAIKDHTSHRVLPENIWRQKYDLIRNVYGFKEDSWEAQTTPREESFIKIKDPVQAMKLLKQYTD